MMHSIMKPNLILTVLYAALIIEFTSGTHVCDRKCIKGEEPMTCHFNWTIENYVTMSKNCFTCPLNVTACSREQCIPANGVRRMITVINRMMPGPAIVVCKNDRIVVDVNNLAGTSDLTIHWHGIDQRGTPFMDGVPFVTQCPIHPFNRFRYSYKVEQAGTFFYHSHLGFQRTDGIHGMLVVRQPKEDDPNHLLYDYDLTAHQMMVSEWANKTSDELFTSFYFSLTDFAINLQNILVNGKGRYMSFVNETDGTTHYTPYETFFVKRGFRYRFRVVNNANWVCPVEMSVDNHDLIVVGSDSDSFKPVTVKRISIDPGERFDFVIDANQDVRTYWMRFRGLLSCEEVGTIGRAILVYETAIMEEPLEVAVADAKSSFPVLNPINNPQINDSEISLTSVESFTPWDISLKEVPDVKFYISFNLVPNMDPIYFDPVYKDYNSLMSVVNDIVFEFPPSPLLSQYEDIPKSRLCTDSDITQNCSSTFCECTHYLKVKLGDVVELIMIDLGVTNNPEASHSWHIHGHNFRVLEQHLMYENNTVAVVKAMDDAGLIKRNLDNPIVKDTVAVPHGGYTVLRFHATNPGFWAFHCHIDVHSEMGMFIVFQVGELDDFAKIPPNFPKCGDFQVPI